MHHTSIEDSVGRYENRKTTKTLEELLKEKYGDLLYKKELSPKHRYFKFLGSKTQIKEMQKNFKYPILPYPKGDNKRYDSSYKLYETKLLF